MKKERLTEIINVFLAKDESVETAALLNEVLEGFDTEAGDKIIELETKVAGLEKQYIDTFKSKLGDKSIQNEPTPEPEPESEVEVKFEDIFK